MEFEVVQAKNGRFYRWSENGTGGEWMPSVTTLTDMLPKGEGFHRWLGSHASYETAMEERDAAAQNGIIVHDVIERLVKGETVTGLDGEGYTDRQYKQVMGFVDWYRTLSDQNPGIGVVDTEVVVSCSVPACTGRIDLVLRSENGEYHVVDYKSGASVYDSHYVQVHAYCAAYAESLDLDPAIVHGAILHLNTATKRGWSHKDVYAVMPREHWQAGLQACASMFDFLYPYGPIFAEARPRVEEVSLG